jgi:hypothetical protein
VSVMCNANSDVAVRRRSVVGMWYRVDVVVVVEASVDATAGTTRSVVSGSTSGAWGQRSRG